MTQHQKVKNELHRKGWVGRNECLQNYISRLGAIIYDLKQEGMEFEVKKVGGDYRYYLVDRTRDQVEMDLASQPRDLKYV